MEYDFVSTKVSIKEKKKIGAAFIVVSGETDFVDSYINVFCQITWIYTGEINTSPFTPTRATVGKTF